MATILTRTALAVALATSTVQASDGEWFNQVQQRIAQDEYDITWQTAVVLDDLSASWHAPNRAQGFRTYFTGAGIRTVPRLEQVPSWEWALVLTDWGQAGAMQPVEKPLLRAEGNRVEYVRGSLVEWYVNEPQGLEQGFTLAGPPTGRSDSSEVWLTMALRGNLHPTVSADGQAIDFVTSSGAPAIHYAQLLVTDATGRELPARMETLTLAGARKIRIVFDGDGAVYPVTVDPLATASAWDAESNQDGAWFGSSVSAAGDVNGDGYADVIVAALFYDNGLAHAGRVYAYHGSASGLNDDAAWIAEGDQEEAHFGAAIGTAGDVNGDGYSDVIVGTASYENEEMAPGRVWVYHGSAAGLGAVPAWTVGSDTPGLTWFGIAVGTAGDVNSDGYSDVVVGASSYTNTEGFEGRAYVYHGSAAGLHTVEAWYVDGEQLNLRLGEAVGTAGDVNDDGYSDVIVGGSGAGEPFAKGQVRVYHGSEQGLSAAADWTRESLYTEVPFGEAAGTAGDVNGDGYSDVIFANGDGGRVDVHHGSAAGLSAVPDWTVQDDQPASRFGSTLSTAGDVNGDGFSDVIIGAFRYDTNENDEGRAVVYHGSPSGLTTVEAWVVEGDEQDGNLARSVCTAGDVNDDGYSDVIIGAWRQDNGEVDEGRAFVYHGSAVGLGFSAGDVSGLFVAKAPGGRIKPTWGSSCTIGDSDYAVYEGILGDFMSHTARFCGTGGLLSKTFVPLSGATYYLVVPMNGTREGSYGLSSAGERSAAVDACLPQQLGACPAR